MAHAVARAVAPHGDGDALVGGLQRLHMVAYGVEDIAAFLRALGGEAAALACTNIDDRTGAFRYRKGRQPSQRNVGEALLPFGLAEVEPVRRQRLIGRAITARAQDLLPGVVIIRDLRQALMRGVL